MMAEAKEETQSLEKGVGNI